MASVTVLEDLKRAAWARTSPVSRSANSWDIRKDCLGNLVRYTDFGNRHSPFGWELEYVGATSPENLHALNWKAVAARSEHIAPRLVAA
jgi:hypothetical protein